MISTALTLPLKAASCELTSDSSWFWSEDQLIEKAHFIFRLKIIKEITKEDYSNYQTQINEILKSKSGLKLNREFVLKNFANSTREWKLDRAKGRATHIKNCKPWTNFEVGKEYLIFINHDTSAFSNILHPKAYEESTGPLDTWYIKIKKTLKKPY